MIDKKSPRLTYHSALGKNFPETRLIFPLLCSSLPWWTWVVFLAPVHREPVWGVEEGRERRRPQEAGSPRWTPTSELGSVDPAPRARCLAPAWSHWPLRGQP